MKFFKKAAAMILAGVMAVTALCAAVSADSILSAKKTAESGKSFSLKLSEKKEHDYKVKLSKSGDLKITVKGSADSFLITVVDSDGTYIKPSNESSFKSGRYYDYSGSGYIGVYWNKSTELCSGTLVFKNLDKGNYYVRIKPGNYTSYSGTGKTSFKFDYPSSDSGSSDAKLDSFSLSVKKGTTISFSALVSGKADASEIKWSTSDKSVATVSGGTVKAVGKGSAVITAKLGSSSLKITIKVTA